MIALVDYGSGNIQAIANIYSRLNIPTIIASRDEDLEQATKVILPGVGAFDQTMRHLEASGLRQGLAERVARLSSRRATAPRRSAWRCCRARLRRNRVPPRLRG